MPEQSDLAAQVRDAPERSRYELDVDGHMAFIDYRLVPGVMMMVHAEVPAALGGRGVGQALVRGALALARSADFKVVPQCSFVTAMMSRHPEWV
jgi:predicted GNAT family acetyltransferase